MKDFTLTIDNSTRSQSRLSLADRFSSKSMKNRAQSTVFSLELTQIAAPVYTYRPVFVDEKSPQALQIKALSRKAYEPVPDRLKMHQ